MSPKDAVTEFVRGLPDGATFPDILDALNDRFGNVDDEGRELSREEWEEAWAAEAERRLADMRSGKTVGIPHEEVMRRLKEKYG